MATMFGGSRLANLRDKRTSGDDACFKKEESLKLSLPDNETDKISYEPSSSKGMNRTQNRLLKGRIERPSNEIQDPKMRNENHYVPQPSFSLKNTQSSFGQNEQLKLVLHDDPPTKEQRKNAVETNPLRTTQKRILIAKEVEKEPQSKPVEHVPAQPLVQTRQVEPQKPVVQYEDKIKEEEIEESMPGESDLVECPEGCGRKFNRKALEKHAKACKLVFMSKRKEFNSEAKRLVTKQQAAIARQQKDKLKKGKVKAFEKTSDNWKAASEDFRAAVKAIKKQTAEEDDNENEGDKQEKEQMKIVTCKYCQKPFAEVFMEKHLGTCAKKRETDKKKTFKKK